MKTNKITEKMTSWKHKWLHGVEVMCIGAIISVSACYFSFVPTTAFAAQIPNTVAATGLKDTINKTTSSEVVSNLTVKELPNEKYDIRPDYAGELYQFLGKPVTEIIGLFPTFTNNYYIDHGRMYDNHWQTVAFSYKYTINQIEISQCDPRYCILGVSVGMDKETARTILAAYDYPFDYFSDDGGYYMHSSDNTEEIEILIMDGKVLTMCVRDLTQAPAWALQAGL